jgi:hypothetical protein
MVGRSESNQHGTPGWFVWPKHATTAAPPETADPSARKDNMNNAADPITQPMAATCQPMGVSNPIFTVATRWQMVAAVRSLDAEANIAIERSERIFA